MTPTCPHCEEPMCPIEVPDERVLFRVFGREFIMRRWGVEYLCIACNTDRQNRPLEDAYHAGKRDGYREGVNEQ